MNSPNLAILGCGNMGTSIIGGLISNAYSPDKICVTDISLEKLAALEKRFGIHSALDSLAAIAKAKIIILAVKPADLQSLCRNIKAKVQLNTPLIISIAAGVTISSLQKWLGAKIPIVRCMPNTPALIGCGASGLFANHLVNTELKDLAEVILRSVGLTVWVKSEELLEAVTAISGSGPAYFFLIMEIMQQIAIEFGLNPDTAKILVLQTALGAARMALESKVDLATLRINVTSKGGVTEQALRVFAEENLTQIFQKALLAAKNHAHQLGKE